MRKLLIPIFALMFLAACPQMVDQHSAELTLVPPNFMTTHRRVGWFCITFPPNKNGLRLGGRFLVLGAWRNQAVIDALIFRSALASN